MTPSSAAPPGVAGYQLAGADVDSETRRAHLTASLPPSFSLATLQLIDAELRSKSGAATSSTSVEVDLTEAESALEHHDHQTAEVYLKKLFRKHWNDLSDALRYRVKRGLANVAFAQGKDLEGGRLLVDAKSHQPRAERALVNEAIGYELLRKTEAAHDLAEGLLDTYPNSGSLLSCWIRTAPEGVSIEALRSRVNVVTESDAQVNVALAIRALESRRYEEAREFARTAVEAEPNWVGAKSILGQALVNLALRRSRDLAGDSVIKIPCDYAEQAVSVLTETVTVAERQGTLRSVADCFVYRGLAYSLREDHEHAEADYRVAIRWIPGNATVYLRFATYLLDRRRYDEAITQLRVSLSISPGSEAEVCLGEALRVRAHPGDLKEAIAIFTRLAMADDASLASSQPQPETGLLTSIRSEAFNELVDSLIDDSRVDEAEALLSDVPGDRFSDVAMAAARAKMRLAKGDLAGATASVDEAIRAISPASLKHDLRNLGLLLMKLDRHGDALPLWQRLKASSDYLIDIRPLVECADRVKQYRIVLDNCEEARKAGIEDRRLLDQELHVLEMFDVGRAISRLQEHLTTHPDDKAAWLHLSRIGLHLRREELVDTHPEKLLSVDEATPYGGHVVVEILRRYGDPNEAVRYAYDLFRRNYDHHLANQTLVMAVMAHRTRQPTFTDCSVVGPGMAVCYAEGGSPDRWMIIEDSPDPNVALDEYPVTHQLSRSLAGKKVGESFLVTRTIGRDRMGVVKEILPKYLYRTRDVCNNWQIKFPDVTFVWVSKIAKDDGTQVDLTDMKLMADERYEHLKQAEELYEAQTPDQPIGLHNLGGALGCSTFEALYFVALAPSMHVRSNDPGDAKAEEVLEDLRSNPTLILDLTALASISLLGLSEVVEKWPGKLIISQTTAAELRTMLDDVTGPTTRSGTFGKNEGGYYYQVDTPDAAHTRAENTRIFLELVLATCEHRGCLEMVDLEPELRDKLCGGLGQDAVESMLLAGAPGHVFWTDDFLNAGIAASEFGVRRAWTQLVIHHADAIGILSKEVFLATCARLVGFRYTSTSISYHMIVKSGEMANWDVRKWPLAESLEIFKAAHVSSDQLAFLAAYTIKGMFGKSPFNLSRQNVIIQILECLFTSPNGRRAISRLARSVPSLFGVDILAADEVTQVIRSWLTEVSTRPRMLGPLISPP